MLIKRTIQKYIESCLFKEKIIVIYGARQVGKTTLAKEIEKKYKEKSLYLNCDEPDVREALYNRTSTELKSFLGNKQFIIVDEAQRVRNIGLTLKLIVDNFPKIQIVATGSSSFELSNEISEPLTGRKYEFFLYPFSLEELAQVYSKIEIKRLLKDRMIFGLYPEIVKNRPRAWMNLKSIAKSYLYKDVIRFQEIKDSEILKKLLQALALQIGNEVSYNELANVVGIDKKTVAKYIQILEKAFIIFRLNPFSRNLRTELRKLRKIYFYDNGVRNAIINNSNQLDLRQDVGALWENFMITERIKYNSNHQNDLNSYFWRTQHKQEIDYIEDIGGKLFGYEIKWSSKKREEPKLWKKTYNNAEFKIINKENYLDFVT
ncbi:MAG: ATPase [Candidatus Omnitrophota bacterium]|nr:MAG: ATPase [Candidatus Omnitrophota bacterium]